MIVPLTIDHAIEVATHMRPWDLREITASRGNDDMEGWARDTMALDGLDAVAWLHNGRPVAMGGGVCHRDRGIVITWFVATPDYQAVAVEIHLHALRMHRTWSLWARSCLALSMDGHTAGRGWLERLGYSEAGKHPMGENMFTLMRRGF